MVESITSNERTDTGVTGVRNVAKCTLWIICLCLAMATLYGCQSPAYKDFISRYPLNDPTSYTKAERKNADGYYSYERQLAADRADTLRYWRKVR